MDWESYRIVTRVRGVTRALVFTQSSGRFVVRESLGDYAARVQTFDSMKKLQYSMTREERRGWQMHYERFHGMTESKFYGN